MEDMEKRLGFHYFQDYDHYQARDLELWVPELASLQASWLVLKAPSVAAIPEEFITGLIQAGIQPILHFDFQVNSAVRPEDLRVLISSYSHWGVKHVIFFDRPNTKSAWTDGSWSQGDLVERFLDRYLPFVRLAEQNGLIPVFLSTAGDHYQSSKWSNPFWVGKTTGQVYQAITAFIFNAVQFIIKRRLWCLREYFFCFLRENNRGSKN